MSERFPSDIIFESIMKEPPFGITPAEAKNVNGMSNAAIRHSLALNFSYGYHRGVGSGGEEDY